MTRLSIARGHEAKQRLRPNGKAIRTTPMCISALMSVYLKENAAFLARALDSMLDQSLPPQEIVLVQDGPLTEELLRTIAAYQNRRPSLFTPVVLERNSGLGEALRIGVLQCRNEIIARMDADDIALPDRLKTQYAFLQSHPHIDAVGGYVSEFDGDETNIYAYKTLPATPEAIQRYARFRNPLQHATVMMRKAAVIRAGNYQPCLYFEDYYLWMRMIKCGSHLANIPSVLVNSRAGRNLYSHRRGWRYAACEYRFLRILLSSRMLSIPEFLMNCMLRLPSRVCMPAFLCRQLYRLLRAGKNGGVQQKTDGA